MKIKYIGLKDEKSDNVAGTGLVWLKGETLEVDDQVAARKLLAHTGVWAKASEQPAKQATADETVKTEPVRAKPGPKPKAKADEGFEDGPGMLPSLVNMEASQLVHIGKTRYGVDLEGTDAEALRSQIVSLENGKGPRGA